MARNLDLVLNIISNCFSLNLQYVLSFKNMINLTIFLLILLANCGRPGRSDGKESASNAGHLG